MLVSGSAIVGLILVLGLCLAGPLMSRVLVRLPRVSAQVAMVQRGFEVLRTRRTAKVTALTLLIYLPDALALWFVVKSVGLGLGFADTLVLLGVASFSTVVPSGPAFIGTLQFAYALAIEFAGALLPLVSRRRRLSRFASPAHRARCHRNFIHRSVGALPACREAEPN